MSRSIGVANADEQSDAAHRRLDNRVDETERELDTIEAKLKEIR